MDKIKIINGRVLTPMRELTGYQVRVEGGRIAGVELYDSATDGAYLVLDARGLYVAPGFVDIHAHGGGGHDFMDGTADAFRGAAQAHARHGTTCLIPTTLSAPDEELFDVFSAYRAAREGNELGAGMPGLHLEGPYFAEAQRGAQDPERLRLPDPAHYGAILRAGAGDILRWSIAPELPGALELGRALAARGILPAIGHSDADEEQMLAAYENGYTHVTHLYSCMSTIRRVKSYRFLGVVETAHLYPEFTVEIIADGRHLPGSLLKTIVQSMGTARVALVTDSMRGAGMPEGNTILGSLKHGLPCVIEDGVAKLLDRSAFAGSVATADLLVRTMVRLAGATVLDAVRMMTLTPARIMGLSKKGMLAPGRDADVVLFDDEIAVRAVLVGGRMVYEG